MLSLLSPIGTQPTAAVQATDPTVRLLQRQAEARHISVAPESGLHGTGETALSSMVEAALTADPAYGLISSLTSHEVTDAYNATANLLSAVYGTADQADEPKLNIVS